jgi:trimethylamine--corrinoid protein Co-methyltransferase
MSDQSDPKAETKPSKGRKRGGSAGRRAAREKPPIIHHPTLVREIPVHELLNAEGVALVHETAMTILEEIGIGFNDDEALELWKDAGADVSGTLVRIPRELVMSLIETVPSEFTLHARNPERTVKIGGRNVIFHPQGGAFFSGLDGVRRRAVKADLPTVVKLVHCLPAIHVTTGWPPFDLSDIEVPLRHLDQLYCPLRYSDKPITANLYSKAVAEDAVAMLGIVFGAEFVANNTVTTALANANTPLKWDATMLDGAKVLARAGQAVIFSPFVMYGASTPPHQLAATAQVVAESLSGVAFTQLLRPGVPALFANSPMGVSMKSGAPALGVPEALLQIYLTGQMARHYKLPWRNSGPFSGSKVVDYYAGHDAALRAHASILSGANWLSHCCGSLEGGMHLSLSKMVHDAELMEACTVFAKGLNYSDLDVAVQMMRDLGEESHFLGADYTRENLPFIPYLQDNETHDTWALNGSKDAFARGLEGARKLLDRYADIEPALDPAIDEALLEFVKTREHELG